VGRFVTALAVVFVLAGCSPSAEQVPLITGPEPHPGGCWLLYEVVDVVADPAFGTAVKGTGAALKWPLGFTATRVGSEVGVMDHSGREVLRTGARYRIEPVDDGEVSAPSDWVVCAVQPCPDCALESGPE
jgi:hypothetical protein